MDLEYLVGSTGTISNSLYLPPGFSSLTLIGAGKRSITYKAKLFEEKVVVKVYREKYIRKYARKYNLNIAKFEYDRNRAFYDILACRPFAARPIGIYGCNDDYTLCFVQEFVEGLKLKQLVERIGKLPPETLEAGKLIVKAASAAGLHDIDLNTGNVLVRRTAKGWLPVIFDFNLVPQYIHPPNPFLALAYRLGIRDRSHRDYRSLRNWSRLST